MKHLMNPLRGHALRTPVRASLGFTATGVLARAIALAATALLTRLLSPEEYGLYPLYAARLSLVSVFATLGIGGGILYRGMQRVGVTRRTALVRRALLVSVLPFSVTAALCLLLAALAPSLWGMPLSLTVLLLLEIGAGIPQSLYAARCRFLYRARPYALITLSQAVLTPLLTVLLIRTLALGALSRILAPVAVAVAIALPLFVMLWRTREDGQTVAHGEGRVLLSEGVSLLPYALALCATEAVGRLVLGQTAGAAELSRYGIAFAIGTAPMLLVSGVQSVLQPWLMRKLAAAEGDAVRRLLRPLCLGVAAATVALTLLSPELLVLLAPPDYRAAELVAPVALSVLPHLLFLILSAAALQQGGRRTVRRMAVLSGALSCGLCLVLIPRYGAIAAAWMTALSYGLLALSQYIALRQTGAARVVDGGFLLALLAATAALSVLSAPLAPYPRLRLSLLAALGALTLRYILPYRRLLTEV